MNDSKDPLNSFSSVYATNDRAVSNAHTYGYYKSARMKTCHKDW